MNPINELKNGINFAKKNPEILSSIALLVLIPTALTVNTILTQKAFDSAMDYFEKEIEYGTGTSNLILARTVDVLIADLISNPEELEKKLGEIVKQSALKKRTGEMLHPRIDEIKIEIHEQDKFKTLAAYPGIGEKISPEILNNGGNREIGQQDLDEVAAEHKILAWNQPPGESIMIAGHNQEGEKFTSFLKTIYDSSGKKIGLLTIVNSLKDFNASILKAVAIKTATEQKSHTILITAIFLILPLLFIHTRFFKYSALYNKIKELDEMKDEFISMTAHELRTPITAIRGYADILRGEIGPALNPTQSEHLSRVIVSSERLNDLINDILDVSRIEQGRLTIEPQEISPAKIIKEIVDELKVKADEKELQLIFEPKLVVSPPNQEEPYSILIDPQRLKQILINIIGNSIKYTQKGKVEVETKVDDIKEKYSISVKDTGLGMSAEAQKRLFEKFYRVKTKDTAAISGTGLGLWITRALTEKMNGEIFLESMEGVGSKFTIVFPLIKKVVAKQT